MPIHLSTQSERNSSDIVGEKKINQPSNLSAFPITKDFM